MEPGDMEPEDMVAVLISAYGVVGGFVLLIGAVHLSWGSMAFGLALMLLALLLHRFTS